MDIRWAPARARAWLSAAVEKKGRVRGINIPRENHRFRTFIYYDEESVVVTRNPARASFFF
jgi:hypothetical protein